MLSAHNLRFGYPGGGFALSVASFEAQEGETVGIGGPSGAGKTTFLRLLCGILKPDAGDVSVGGDKLDALTSKQLRALRLKRLGLVFQDFALLDYLSVEDNILLPSRLGGALTEELRAHSRELTERLEISRHWKRLCRDLSQGERQRVAVARALAHAPRVVLADEPTSSLDTRRKLTVIDLLTAYAKEKRAAIVIVTHDTDLFARLDRSVNVEEWAR